MAHPLAQLFQQPLHASPLSAEIMKVSSNLALAFKCSVKASRLSRGTRSICQHQQFWRMSLRSLGSMDSTLVDSLARVDQQRDDVRVRRA